MSETASPQRNSRLRALVRGEVQGGYSRDFAWLHAPKLALVGWVRNLSDGGTVEVVAEGPDSALTELLTHLQKGPRGAYVAQVETEWDVAQGDLSSFTALVYCSLRATFSNARMIETLLMQGKHQQIVDNR